MKTYEVLLNTIDKIEKFCNRCTKFDFDIDIISGRISIDAKSIMGVFGLNVQSPLLVCINPRSDSDIKEFENSILEFMV